jgi:hypothetical protein
MRNDFERRKLFLFKKPLKTSTGNNPSGPATSEIDIDAEINFADITPN